MKLHHVLFSFSGRINRARYWLGTLITVIPWLIFIGLFSVAAARSDLEGAMTSVIVLGALAAVVALAVLAVAIAIGVKRLHDRDKSGWFLLLFWGMPLGVDQLTDYVENIPAAEWALHVVALALWIWGLIELGFLRGTKGANRYGADPLEAAAPPAA